MRRAIVMSLFVLVSCANTKPTLAPDPGPSPVPAHRIQTAPNLTAGLVGSLVSGADELAVDVGSRSQLFAILRDGRVNCVVRVEEDFGQHRRCSIVGTRRTPLQVGDVAVLTRWKTVTEENENASRPKQVAPGMPFGEHPFGPWDKQPPEFKPFVTREYLQHVCFVGSVGEPTAEGSRRLSKHWGDTTSVFLETDSGLVLIAEPFGSTAVLRAAMWRDQAKLEALPTGERVVGWRYVDRGTERQVRAGKSIPSYSWEDLPVILTARTCELHVPHGTMPGLGQRFEVLRSGMHWGWAIVKEVRGRKVVCRADQMCFDDDLNVGDTLASRLWNPTTPVRLAMHGTFSEEDHGQTREQFESWLRGIGVQLDERVSRETKLVLVGSHLLQDSHYRSARDNFRFEVIRCEDVVEYFEPERK